MEADRRLDHYAGSARIRRARRHAVRADLAAQADVPVGVEQLERRAQRKVVLKRHDRRRAREADHVEHGEGKAGELLYVDGVGLHVFEGAREDALDSRLRDLELGLATVVVKRRVHELQHGHAVAFPAPHAGASGEGILAPAEEVGHLVPPAGLLSHEVLDVRHEAAPSPRAKAGA